MMMSCWPRPRSRSSLHQNQKVDQRWNQSTVLGRTRNQQIRCQISTSPCSRFQMYLRSKRLDWLPLVYPPWILLLILLLLLPRSLPSRPPQHQHQHQHQSRQILYLQFPFCHLLLVVVLLSTTQQKQKLQLWEQTMPPSDRAQIVSQIRFVASECLPLLLLHQSCFVLLQVQQIPQIASILLSCVVFPRDLSSVALPSSSKQAAFVSCQEVFV
mmetsp:Transcript_20586/g.22994  ORF Transcript_20586/g.22994 Transcript_20586/m.22994 type:complete len:213 (-) Transcript_20586:3243-3881(-)